jgi:hypothetical protein
MADKGKNIKFKKLECPFDLEAVLQISYSTAGLKQVLEFIIDHLGEIRQAQTESEEFAAALYVIYLNCLTDFNFIWQ